MNPLEKQLEEKLDTLDFAISRARVNVNTDISRTADEIENICSKIKKLPPKDAKNFEDIMLRMIGKLDEFAEELYNMKQRLEEKRKT